MVEGIGLLGNHGLVQARRGFVHDGERLGDGDRIARGRGRVLVFTTKIHGETACLGAPAEAGYVVEAGLIRASVVIDDGQPDMIAVVERNSGDAKRTSVERFDFAVSMGRVGDRLDVGIQFILQRLEYLSGIFIVAVIDLVGREFEDVREAQAGPRAQAEESRIHEAF